MSYRAFFASGSLVFLAACGRSGGAEAPSSSEVAVSVVSGAMNNTSGSAVALNAPAQPRTKLVDRVLDAINPIGTAWAAEWSCTGGTLSPAFSGPGADPYAFTPPSCSITWRTDRTATSSWSGPFTLSYGAGCDGTHPFIEGQTAGCSVTRTTGSSGVTRDITGPDGNAYAILHDTNGAGTGWDSSVTPAPSNGGLVATCGAEGCLAGRDIVLNGSHLTGTVTLGKDTDKIWDHTVTGSVSVAGAGATRVATGSVTVQHNLLMYTATATFNDVAYGEVGCCFPTSGTVSTTFSKGPDVGKTETLTFSEICGEATLKTADGVSEPLTLQHCL